MSAKLAVFRDELRGLGSEQQMRRREAELLRELARHPDLGLRLNGPDVQTLVRAPAAACASEPARQPRTRCPAGAGNDASPRLTVILDIIITSTSCNAQRQLIWLTMNLSALATALLGRLEPPAPATAPLRQIRQSPRGFRQLRTTR